ncbi:hypothetical protein TNCV_4012211 [Trichonephila clavipes]|nr:hypothetical protein TNCV_4012211 [Trichonephila clavipes]
MVINWFPPTLLLKALISFSALACPATSLQMPFSTAGPAFKGLLPVCFLGHQRLNSIQEVSPSSFLDFRITHPVDEVLQRQDFSLLQSDSQKTPSEKASRRPAPVLSCVWTLSAAVTSAGVCCNPSHILSERALQSINESVKIQPLCFRQSLQNVSSVGSKRRQLTGRPWSGSPTGLHPPLWRIGSYTPAKRTFRHMCRKLDGRVE